MRLPFRRGPRRTADRVAEFWRWWSEEGRAAAERSVAGGTDLQDFAAVMGARVSALGALDWELTAGTTSAHVLVISAGGDPDERATARRVVLAAPPADAAWSYVDTRPPAGDPEAVVLSAVGAHEVDFARITVGARKQGPRFDVVVHHPSFAGLTAQERTQVCFLALDAALGEIDAGLWIGDVQPSELAPLDGFGLSALRAVVQDLKAQHVDADGHPAWTVLQGESGAGTVRAAAQVPLHPLTAPSFDTYVAVVVPYADRDDDGLPTDDSLEALRQLETTLGARLGTGGAVVAHQSGAGVSTLHLYLDGAADLVTTVREVAAGWSQGPVSIHEIHDPAWDSVRHLRV